MKGGNNIRIDQGDTNIIDFMRAELPIVEHPNNTIRIHLITNNTNPAMKSTGMHKVTREIIENIEAMKADKTTIDPPKGFIRIPPINQEIKNITQKIKIIQIIRLRKIRKNKKIIGMLNMIQMIGKIEMIDMIEKIEMIETIKLNTMKSMKKRLIEITAMKSRIRSNLFENQAEQKKKIKRERKAEAWIM